MNNQYNSIIPDTIIQWNIRGLKANSLELKLLLNNYNPICVTINETMLNDPSLVTNKSFKNYSTHFDSTDNSKKGNLIMVKKTVSYKILKLNTNLNALAVKINRSSDSINICSIYLNHGPLDAEELNHLIKQLPRPFILLGDFNARNEFWHDNITNDRGTKVLGSIMENNLEILNSDQPTHLDSKHKQFSTLDLSLSTQDMASNLYWERHPDLCCSDHFPIIITLLNHNQINPHFYWKLNKADWNSFFNNTREISYDDKETC